MTTEGSTENESRYRNLLESILRERLLFRNPGRFSPSTFRHQDVSDLDVSAPKKLRHFLVLSEIRHTYTNLNGSKHANIVHVTEIHVCYSIHPSIHQSIHLVSKYFGAETSWYRNFYGYLEVWYRIVLMLKRLGPRVWGRNF